MKGLVYSLAAAFVGLTIPTECRDGMVSAVPKQPVIGIITVVYNKSKDRTMMATYERFFNGSGVQVIPLMGVQQMGEDIQKKLYDSLSSVMLQGGDNVGDDYKYIANTTLGFAQADWQRGVQKPIFGACYGIEFAMKFFDPKIKKRKRVARKVIPVKFPGKTTKGDYVATSGMSDKLAANIQNHSVTTNNHHYGFRPSDYKKNSFFEVVLESKATLPKGYTFAALIEGRNKSHPIYATQFHPERVEAKQRIDREWQQKFSDYYAGFCQSKIRSFPTFPTALLEKIQALPYTIIDNQQFYNKDRPAIVYNATTVAAFTKLVTDYYKEN